jgi:ABC-type antimicrobial peptide transport system permease subunit
LVLLSIVALGAALGLVLLGVASSLGQSLRLKGALYFGGDVAVLGYSSTGRHLNGDDPTVLATLKNSGIPYRSLARRTVSYQSETILFFSNNSLKQRRLIGVDLALERRALEALDLAEGSLDGLAHGPGILVSQVTAAKLGVRTGDTCTLLLNTFEGSKNTLSVVVSGIFRDTSFFGYSSYLSIETLNQALNLPVGSSTEMGLTLEDGASAPDAAARLQKALASRLAVVPLLKSKADLDALDDQPPSKTSRYAVMTLDVRLAQIQDILDALVVVSVVLNGLFLIIVVLGVGNTFRAVLVERTREIGVYRALGMVRARLVGLILTEVAVLAAAGGVVGTLVGTLVLAALTGVDWGANSLAAMFLRRGHLAWAWPALQAGGLFLVSVIAGALGALGPALKAARWKPVDALRHRA